MISAVASSYAAGDAIISTPKNARIRTATCAPNRIAEMPMCSVNTPARIRNTTWSGSHNMSTAAINGPNASIDCSACGSFCGGTTNRMQSTPSVVTMKLIRLLRTIRIPPWKPNT